MNPRVFSCVFTGVIASLILSSTPAKAGRNNWMYVCSGRDSAGDEVRISSTRIEGISDQRTLFYQNRTRLKPGFGTIQDPFVTLSFRYDVRPESLTHQRVGFEAGKRFILNVQFLSSPLTWPDDQKPIETNARFNLTIYSGIRADSAIEKETSASLFCYTRKGGE